MNTNEIIEKAKQKGLVVPAFNIPYLPMVKPVIEAVVEENSFALIQVARIEWEKFESKSLQAVRDEYMLWKNDSHTRLHLDHVPVIDEDLKEVDYIKIIEEAIKLGYESIMVDASRLSLEDNIECTKKACELAHNAGIPCEAELGAVMGHESGPIPPYEEIFRSRKGFTSIEEASIFAQKSGCDWLSVAIGNIHGAVAAAVRDKKKPEARLDIGHLQKIREVTHIPLVLHGGSGIKVEFIRESIKNGIAKINVGTEIRQAYEQGLRKTNDVEKAREAVYLKTKNILAVELRIHDSRNIVFKS